MTVDYNISNIQSGDVGVITAVSIIALIMVLIVVAIGRQPVFDANLVFKVIRVIFIRLLKRNNQFIDYLNVIGSSSATDTMLEHSHKPLSDAATGSSDLDQIWRLDVYR